MITLKAEPRVKLGKDAQSLREIGYIPAELYGRGLENIHVKFPLHDFLTVFNEAGESAIINVDLEGAIYPVLIYGVQYDHLNEHIIHVDLYRVNMQETITTDIPLEFIGEAPAVKVFNGVLITSLDSVEVESLPANLPSHIEVDLSVLANIHDAIHVSDLVKKGEFEILNDPETVIASISEQAQEEESTSVLTPEDVVVESEKKKEEGDKKEE